MATWRDRLVPAKFRGVPFFVTRSNASGGRRNAVHEFPFSNDPPYVEDTGKRGHAFEVAGYVVGSEYLAARDALIKALNTEGPGELIHPYHGTRRVMMDKWTVEESGNDGGFATFSISFLETIGEPANPKSIAGSAAALKSNATKAIASVSDEFSAKFSAAVALRGSVTSAIGKFSRAVGKVLERVNLAKQEAASLKQDLDRAISTASSLAHTPEALLSTQLLIFEKFATGIAASASANPALEILGLYDIDLGDRPPATTPTREVEQANFDANKALNQRLALIYAATVAVDQTFANYDEATRLRVGITDRIDEQVETVSDAGYAALIQLRADVVRAIPGEDSDLPRILKFTPGAMLPSIVLAHRLYGDLDSELDLVARNKIAHPAFVSGFAELEILSRG